jgi:alpha-D-xyloside xylohydrolase
LRVRATRNAAFHDAAAGPDAPGALLPPAPAEAQIAVGEEGATIQNGEIIAEVSARGALRFRNASTDEVVLSDQQPEVAFIGPSAREFKPVGGDLYHIEAWFASHAGERLYGLGQQQHGLLDQKGCVVDLMQRNTKVCIPFLLSSQGYGLLWHHPGVGRVELGRNGTRWVAEAARQLDLWVTVGPTPAAILENYTAVTGRAPMLPPWASGFWQCKLRYKTQDELLAVAREHTRRGLPLSVIVIDYFHWTLQGDWRLDPDDWPDPTAMVEELREMGVEVMVSIWPTVNPMSENFVAMERQGYLVRTERGVQPLRFFVDNRPEGRVYLYFYDPTHPGARDFIWARCRENYYRHGIRVFWLDADEPEINPVDPENLRYHAGPGLEVTNAYPLAHQQAFYEGLRAEGEDEIITLSRSAWAGSQRYGAAVWSGDIASTFEALQRQVRAGLNIGLSGIPWWTTDIGGFHGGDPTTPYFRELIVRWFQYGTFCPLFRLHGNRLPFVDGSGADNEVWTFGGEAYAIIREYLHLRERLRPYIMAQMQQAHETGAPPMRPLFFDFPEDEMAWAVEDAFMFGPDLLVAPVLHEGATRREVYLPAGATWSDAWTGETFEGGQVIAADAPLDRIPLYLRDDAALPIQAPPAA